MQPQFHRCRRLIGIIPPFVGAWFRGVGLAGGGKPSPPEGPGYERGGVGEPGDAFNLWESRLDSSNICHMGSLGSNNKRSHLTDDILSDSEEAARSYGKSSNTLDRDRVGRS